MTDTSYPLLQQKYNCSILGEWQIFENQKWVDLPSKGLGFDFHIICVYWNLEQLSNYSEKERVKGMTKPQVSY